MYGLIQSCLRSWILQDHGQELWEKVLVKCPDISNDADFLHYKIYADSVMYRLVHAFSDVTGMPAEDVMVGVGRHFLPFATDIGFGDILRGIGQTFESFLQNIDYLHWYLMSTAFAGIQSPSFRAELLQRDGESLVLNYYSRRECCTGIVTGLLHAVAKDIFNIHVKITTLSTHKQLISNKIMVHCRFRITQHAVGMPWLPLKWVRPWPVLPRGRKHEQRQPLTITAHLFCRIHPYHIVFNRELRILQTGLGLALHIPETQKPGARLDQMFIMAWPEVTLTVENIERFSNLMFQLHHAYTVGGEKRWFRLKGSVVSMEGDSLTGAPLLLYLGSPLARSVKDLEHMSLKISDIPSYDSTRDLILLKDQRNLEFDVMKQLEATTSELSGTAAALQQEMKKTDELLHSMIPPSVAEKLKRNQPVQETFDEVTDLTFGLAAAVLFSDIVTFTQIAAGCSPLQVVQLLNQLYTYFDELTEHNNVYKVETIGDAYMAVGGCPEPVPEHAQLMAQQAHQMIRGAGRVLVPHTEKPVQIRVGMHTGPVVAGIVGVKMPRFCLFGDTVNTAARMESHGLPGHIHVSHSTYTCLRGNPRFFLERRGQIPVKGKGMMDTYFVHDLSPTEPPAPDPPAPAFMQYKGTATAQPLVLVPPKRRRCSVICAIA